MLMSKYVRNMKVRAQPLIKGQDVMKKLTSLDFSAISLNFQLFLPQLKLRSEENVAPAVVSKKEA